MAAKTVNFHTNCDLNESEWTAVAKWMSCNGEFWGVGPTVVFASAAALFLYSELQATVFIAGDQAHITMLEKTLISTMVLGMLSLMVHLWVCSMRFFQYYLDTLVRDSPNMLLEMTTAGLLGSQTDLVPIGPLTRFLKQQQPQIHITICWFLSLCYADYVRKNYCARFNMPYLETWQTQLQERVYRGAQDTITKINNFVGEVHQRLRGFTQENQPSPNTGTQTESGSGRASSCVSFGNKKVSSKTIMRRASTPALAATTSGIKWPPEKELCVRLISQSSETAADALERLRTFVKDTSVPPGVDNNRCTSDTCTANTSSPKDNGKDNQKKSASR